MDPKAQPDAASETNTSSSTLLAGSAHRRLGIDGLGPAEEHDRLVDDVRAKVKDQTDASARLRIIFPRPAGIDLRLPTLVARFEGMQGPSSPLATAA